MQTTKSVPRRLSRIKAFQFLYGLEFAEIQALKTIIRIFRPKKVMKKISAKGSHGNLSSVFGKIPKSLISLFSNIPRNGVWTEWEKWSFAFFASPFLK